MNSLLEQLSSTIAFRKSRYDLYLQDVISWKRLETIIVVKVNFRRLGLVDAQHAVLKRIALVFGQSSAVFSFEELIQRAVEEEHINRKQRKTDFKRYFQEGFIS